MRLSFYFAILLTISSLSCLGDDIEELQARRAVESRAYTVKVHGTQGDLLAQQTKQLHGSGIIVRLDGESGLVFTNNHVVRKPRRIAAKFEVEVFDGNGSRERVPAQVVFQSPIRDFALLQFKLSDLKRMGGDLREAPLATESDMKELASAGQTVMAAGNPYDTKDVRTFGSISGTHFFAQDGEFLQTDAPVNPGNSGGPLIHVRSGKVVGINTCGYNEGDGISFALPIHHAFEEAQRWLADPRYGRHRSVMALFTTHPMSMLTKAMKLEELLESANLEADFTDRYEELFVVAKATPESGLIQGDIVLSVDGLPIGDRWDRVRKAIHHARNEAVQIRVLRNREFLTISCPIVELGEDIGTGDGKLVYLSGFVFEEVNDLIAFGKLNGETRVLITQILPRSIAHNHFSSLEGSFLNGIVVGGVRYPVRSIDDLKRALSHFQPETNDVIALSLYRPAVIRNDQGRSFPVPDLEFPPLLALRSYAEDILVRANHALDETSLSLAEAHARFEPAMLGGDLLPDLLGNSSGRQGLGCAITVANSGEIR